MEYKQTKYMLAVHAKGDYLPVETSIEEAELQLSKFTNRKAVLISKSFERDDLEKISYKQVQTFKRGTIRQVDTSGASTPAELFDKVYWGLKNGMLIVHDVPTDEDFIKKALNHVEKGLDIVIHRNSLNFSQAEIAYIRNQLQLAKEARAKGEKYMPPKQFIVRMHINNDFRVDIETLVEFVENTRAMFSDIEYANQLGNLFFLAQFVVNKKKIEYTRICQNEAKVAGEKIEDFINVHHYRRETNVHVYIDVMNLAILKADTAFVEQCQKTIFEHLQKQQMQNG